MKPHDIIKTIEEYRKAFWAYKDLEFLQTKRYSPIVGWQHISQYGQEPSYHAWIMDTWVDIPRPGMFSLVKVKVPNSNFKSDTLELALKELLDFCRNSFVDDTLFSNIKNISI